MSGPIFIFDCIFQNKLYHGIKHLAVQKYIILFDALVKRWDKCINVGGSYFEKYFFFSLEYHI
jgi:hypothetical protein